MATSQGMLISNAANLICDKLIAVPNVIYSLRLMTNTYKGK